ncbi:MAG TPA: CHASE3 domain-containing protein [Caulobacteraceae bacterium]|jgi:signal transduction histidine kinase
MPIAGKTFIRTSVALVLASVLALLAIVATSLALVEGTRSRTEDVARAQDTRLHAYRLLSVVQDAETGQRGYLLTGDASYLQPHETAQRELPVELAALEASGVKDRIGVLKTAIDGKMAELQHTIDLVRGGRQAEAMQIVRGGHGKAVMEQIRAEVDQLTNSSNARVQARLLSLRDQAETLRQVSIGGGVLIILFAAAAGWTVLRYTRELVVARNETAKLNAELEDRVLARTRDLTRANDEIQKFAYIVSHDLRAPLVNVMGFTSELQESLGTLEAHFAETGGAEATPSANAARAAVKDDIPESIGFIRASTSKMDGLINAILKLSREGGRVLSPEAVNLEDLISRASDAVRHQLEERGATVSIEGTLPTVTSDRLALEQVFGNLIDNAVKYLKPGRPGRIAVRARPEASRVTIEVEDNGRGVAPQDHERIFELFRRSGVQDQRGEGIGLAHVRALVRRLGGDITVESTLGEGSTFRVRLPRTLVVSDRSAS